MKYLVTGSAGFIGFYVCQRLIAQGHQIVGVDNLNDYYEVTLKQDRLKQLLSVPGFRFEQLDLSDRNGIASLFAKEKFQRVIHLAAQAGVRYSLINPESYINTNIIGFFRLIDYAKNCGCEKIVYASSASVYGRNPIPWSEDMNLEKPMSLYGATKISAESIADSYYEMFGLKSVGLRFFSVYGPWGRPDLSLWKWTEGILKNEEIDLFFNLSRYGQFANLPDNLYYYRQI